MVYEAQFLVGDPIPGASRKIIEKKPLNVKRIHIKMCPHQRQKRKAIKTKKEHPKNLT